ncbi:MAG: hypothetical protein LBB08_01540 [Rickettsiales bacterium]|jgi:hypothetical protein|nr:hypothetical protein [Rickettsiales bacterium]
MKKKIIIFSSVLGLAVITGYRIQKLRAEGDFVVPNVSRLQGGGIPREYVAAKKTSDVLREPLAVSSGLALVSASRIGRFAVGDKISGTDARIISVAKTIDLDSGMFLVRVSPEISGDVFVEKKHTGFFLPIDSVLPKGARIVAKDAERIVAAGIKDGDLIQVK